MGCKKIMKPLLHVFEQILRTRENVLENYKKILAIARGEAVKVTNDFPLPHTQIFDMDDMVLLNIDVKQIVLDVNLPKKKGNVDDMFVFQKIPT